VVPDTLPKNSECHSGSAELAKKEEEDDVDPSSIWFLGHGQILRRCKRQPWVGVHPNRTPVMISGLLCVFASHPPLLIFSFARLRITHTSSASCGMS
jgi:hypothetical protein